MNRYRLIEVKHDIPLWYVQGMIVDALVCDESGYTANKHLNEYQQPCLYYKGKSYCRIKYEKVARKIIVLKREYYAENEKEIA